MPQRNGPWVGHSRPRLRLPLHLRSRLRLPRRPNLRTGTGYFPTNVPQRNGPWVGHSLPKLRLQRPPRHQRQPLVCPPRRQKLPIWTGFCPTSAPQESGLCAAHNRLHQQRCLLRRQGLPKITTLLRSRIGTEPRHEGPRIEGLPGRPPCQRGPHLRRRPIERARRSSLRGPGIPSQTSSSRTSAPSNRDFLHRANPPPTDPRRRPVPWSLRATFFCPTNMRLVIELSQKPPEPTPERLLLFVGWASRPLIPMLLVSRPSPQKGQQRSGSGRALLDGGAVLSGVLICRGRSILNSPRP